MGNSVTVNAADIKSLEKARSVFFDLAEEMLCIVAVNGHIIEVNKTFTQTTEYTKLELISNSLLQFIHPADQLKVKENLTSLSNVPLKQFNCRLKFKNNSFHLLHFTAIFNNESGFIFIKIKGLSKDADDILESITDGFFAIDNNWIITYWNQNAQLLLNKEKKNVLGVSVWDCYPKEIGKGFYNHYHKAMKEQVTVHFEEYLAEVDKWFEVTAYPSVDGLSVYFRDVSERVKYQRELREINNRMEYVLKANSGVVWDYSIERNEVYMHGDSFKVLFGYDFENTVLPNRFWKDVLIHPDDRERVVESFEKTIAEKGDYWSEQYYFKKADGTYAFVLDRGYVRKNNEGKPFQMIGSIEDITKDKENEQALQESEKNYKKLFNSSPIPLVIYDTETFQILEANENVYNLYGYTQQEILQMNVLQLRPKEDYEKFRHYINNLNISTHPTITAWAHLKKNGEKITVEVSSSKIKYKNKEAVLAAIFDITDRLKLESKIADLKVLQQKSITQATISGQEKERAELGRELHDNIQQVLTATKLYLDLAEVNAELRVEMIGKSIKHLLYSISEIRSISKSLLPPSLNNISLSEAIEEIIESYRITTNVLFHFSFNPEINSLSTDLQTSFYRIVQEQCNNIIKYADAENVWIDFSIENGTLILNIKDDGKGFDTTKKRLGIGITNMKNRVELFDGTMKITSAPGDGCVINIEIPLVVADEHINNNAGHIFIAENNEDDRNFIKAAFKEVAPQHQITFAGNGIELMQILQSLPEEVEPSLIVLDFNMPMDNGLETLKALLVLHRFKNVPKIIYSTSSNQYYKDQSLEASETAYLAKGITKTEIIKDVQQMIRFMKNKA